MRRGCLLITALVLAGCAGLSSPTLPAAVPDGASKVGNKDTGTAVISITIPTPAPKSNGIRPAYVSPSTKAMTISLTGPTALVKTIGLRPQSRNCAVEESGTICNERIVLAPCPSKDRCYSGSIATYDEVSCVRSVCTVPTGAHQLSTNQAVAFSITARKKTRISLALDGIPTSVALIPLAPSTLSGSSSSGFTISKCVTTPQNVIVAGVDAGGNQIVGRGAPAPTLTSNDATHLSVAQPRSATPSTFGLVPPSSLQSATLPRPGSVVQLTAGVTPLPQSGGSAQSLKTGVTFSHDLCGVITETSIPTAGSAPRSITTGPDGALWFTENGGNKIGRITTAGVITETSIPTTFSAPVGITAGPDGALWFTESCGNKIGRITTAGTITETSIRTLVSGPSFITSGPDGALWFTQFNTDQIGRITTSGAITETAIPTIGSQPQGITTGPDGALWFAENFANRIGRITTSGTTIGTLIPTLGNYPFGITSGPDGALWFTECNSNKIGRITTAGVITETATPTGESSPLGITTGPDGALWFAESGGNQIGRITTGGVITEMLIPTSNSVPYGVTSGPDGALWFTEAAAGKVGRLQ